MGGFSFTHWLFIIFLFLLFFGPNKVSDVTKSLGKALRNYRQSKNEIEVSAHDIVDDPDLIERQRKNKKGL